MTTTGTTAAGPAGDDVDPATTQLVLDVLTQAALAHGRYEEEIGGHHAEWPAWYAQHMARTLTASGWELTRRAQ